MITRVAVITEGLMNRNWRVTTAAGVWAVKQLLDVGPEVARQQYRAAATLAGLDLPVPAPVLAGDDSVVFIDGAAYAVLPWVTGVHRAGHSLTLAEAAALGELLAALHLALADVLEPAPDRLLVPVTDLPTARAKINRYLSLIGQQATPDNFDRYVEAQLHHRRRLLEQATHLHPAGETLVGPCGYTHGDFQHLNILWNKGRVSAVLDWDRLDIRPLGLEVARSATLLFGYGDERGLDLARVAAFSSGYRRHRPISSPDLANAVHRLWWERLSNDLWQLELHYGRSDTSCDHLFVSASELLHWWTANLEAATDAFTAAN
ncbi:phosphotransferase [Dactylosporangium sp. CA-092794]|uniref:phosphotransferase n=1 Tax=Dactylosporangium sp. CA-092794 TaxID=3239929 RepID=UPI003D8CA842